MGHDIKKQKQRLHGLTKGISWGLLSNLASLICFPILFCINYIVPEYVESEI